MNPTDTGRNLLDCLNEIVTLLESAYRVSLQEQQALVDNDAQQLVLSCRAQEEILRRIKEADQRAYAFSQRLAAEKGLDIGSSGSDVIAEAAGFPTSELIKQATARIASAAEKVREVNEINAQLLRNGLDIIACCIRALAGEPGPGTYSKTAGISDGEPQILSLNIQA